MKESILPLLAVSLATLSFAWPLKSLAGDVPAAEATGTKVSGPHTHDNLTIYLIHGKSAAGPVPLTLEEALDKGSVTVHETGSVSELAIENTGKDDVLIHAGDIVKGGQQDRVLTTTMILKSKSGKVPLSAFCVEQGRWAKRGVEDVKRFASAKEMMPSKEAKMALRSKFKEPPVAAAATTAAGSDRRIVEQRADVDQGMATANIDPADRQQVQQRADGPARARGGYNAQGEVWKNVAGIQAALSANVGSKVNAAASESSLQLALENEKVETARKGYVDALMAAGQTDGDVVGYAFAINGKINSADVYSSNALFRKLWPRLLKAAATEALGSKTTTDAAAPAPAPAAVDAFLADAASGKASDHEPVKGHMLKMRESDKADDFETVGSDGAFVHRSVLAR